MGSGTDGVFDRVYLGPDAPAFELRHKEAHLPELYRQFPEEKATIDELGSSTRGLGIQKKTLIGQVKELQKQVMDLQVASASAKKKDMAIFIKWIPHFRRIHRKSA